ncbi:hypothetical protein ACMFMF_011883 [Clarireedia jacksonii]
MSKHLTDNNHDSQQTQRRRRPDPLSSDSPPSKTLADKQTTENTSTKTKLPVATTGLAPPALPTVTLASPPATIPGVNESCTAESMDNRAFVPPIQNEKDAAESVAGGREPHQDEVSWKEVKKRKTLHEYVDVDPPKKGYQSLTRR